jgi:hypothetical protein
MKSVNKKVTAAEVAMFIKCWTHEMLQCIAADERALESALAEAGTTASATEMKSLLQNMYRTCSRRESKAS